MNEFEDRCKKAEEFFEKKHFVIDSARLRAIMSAVDNGFPLLATGPTGCGKTKFFTLLAEFLGGKYHYQSLNGSVTIHDLTQERILNKDGTFGAQDMILAEWLRDSQKETSVLQLDEVNAAKAETLLALHAVMDIKGELKLPFSDETLKVNKKSVLVMSCNEGDEYAGINAMNVAFQNRYVKIHFPYIRGTPLIKLLMNLTGATEKQCECVVNVWQKYMDSKDPDQPTVSVRILEYWLHMAKQIGLKSAGEYTFASLVAQDEKELIEILEGDFFVNVTED